jgi:Protein of unknown function (DUF2927)
MNMWVALSSVGTARRSKTASTRRQCSIRTILLASFTLALAGIYSGPAKAENPDLGNRKMSERADFTDSEIKDGFFKIALRAELQLGAPAERVRKFDEPVRIFVTSMGLPDRRPEIAATVADIRAHVNHLDVAVTNDRHAANFFVTLVTGRNLSRAIRSRYGSGTATQIEQSLHPQCLSGIGKDKRFRIRRAEVILPADADDFTFHDCAYEELLQALGAINDDRSIPWTMFNDDVQMGFFDIYDQYLLNILYDPRVQPGMTKGAVNSVFPEVLPTVRAWVANANPARDADRHKTSETSGGPAGTAALLQSTNRGSAAN